MTIDSEDEEFMQAGEYIESVYRKRYDVGCRIHRDPNIRESKQISAKTINVKKLDAPRFSGNVRDFPTFVKLKLLKLDRAKRGLMENLNCYSDF